jgi:serine/threonine protein kinase
MNGLYRTPAPRLIEGTLAHSSGSRASVPAGDGHSPGENRLGQYRLVAAIGRGDKADVHLAVLDGPAVNKLLAVKELRQRSLQDNTDDGRAQTFLDRARTATRLSHPNVVQTLEVGSDGSRRFVAMEYLEGQPLHRVIHRAGGCNTALSLQTHLVILVEVLGALGYAHTFAELDGAPRPIFHGGISPHKVILTYEGHVKLVDFGVATADGPARASEGMAKGRTHYMAPEQAMGRGVDPRADVFAVGVMLWEALVGEGPWAGETDAAIMRNLTAGKVPPLSALDSGLDEDLVAIVNRAVSANPRDRYLTALAMRDDLESRITARGKRWPLATLRGLPTLLGTLFDTDRHELHALVEAQVRDPRDPPGKPSILAGVRTEASQPTRRALSQPAVTPREAIPLLPAMDAPLSTPGLKVWLTLGAAAITLVVAIAVARDRPTAKPSIPAALDARSPASAVAPVTSSPEQPASSSVEPRVSPPIDRERPRAAAPKSPPRVVVEVKPPPVPSVATDVASVQVPPPAPDAPLHTTRPKREVDRENPYAQ